MKRAELLAEQELGGKEHIAEIHGYGEAQGFQYILMKLYKGGTKNSG